MKKQDLKQSEARILVYLSVVHDTRKHLTAIASKLEIDYSYTMRILAAMVAKGWLRKQQNRRFMYYHPTHFAPLESAKNLVIAQNLQVVLKTEDTQEELPKPSKPVLQPDYVTSNCCGGAVENDVCQSCFEPCESVPYDKE